MRIAIDGTLRALRGGAEIKLSEILADQFIPHPRDTSTESRRKVNWPRSDNVQLRSMFSAKV